MMRKNISTQQGFTLVELMIGIALTLLILTSVLKILASHLTIWTLEKNQTHLQQTARIAVDKIMEDIRYAQEVHLNGSSSLTITKLNGELTTFQLGTGLHDRTLYMIVDKRNALPVGGMSRNPITENLVTSLLFVPYSLTTHIEAMAITIEVTDQATGHIQRIHTVGYPWNQ